MTDQDLADCRSLKKRTSVCCGSLRKNQRAADLKKRPAAAGARREPAQRELETGPIQNIEMNDTTFLILCYFTNEVLEDLLTSRTDSVSAGNVKK